MCIRDSGETDNGVFPILSSPSSAWNDTEMLEPDIAVIDRTDIEGVLFRKLVLKVRILSTTTTFNRIVVWFGGRLVTPWI